MARISKSFGSFKLDIRKISINFCIFFMFVTILVNEMTTGTIRTLFRTASFLMLPACAVLMCKKRINFVRALYIAACMITGILNHVLIGNTPISNQVLMVLFIFASLLFTDRKAQEKTMIYGLFLIAGFILYRYLTVGFFARIFLLSSENFTSVYLLFPTCVYYILCERNKKTIRMYPALITWVLCLLGRGRGGIVSSSALLVGLIFYRNYKSTQIKKIIMVCVLIVIAAGVMLNLPAIADKLSHTEIFHDFSEKGVNNDSRGRIWSNYFKKVFISLKYVLLGGELKNTIALRKYNGNLHNTYLQIHAFNGLVMVLFTVSLLIRNLICAFRNKKWLYCICTAVIMFRAFTDIIFWPQVGTPILFFLLFLPFDDKNYLCKEHHTWLAKIIQFIRSKQCEGS